MFQFSKFIFCIILLLVFKKPLLRYGLSARCGSCVVLEENNQSQAMLSEARSYLLEICFSAMERRMERLW